MESKYLCIIDGELVFDNVAHDALNEHNVDEANAELAERAIDCRREFEYNIDRDMKNNLILAYIEIGMGIVFGIVAIVLTVILDWGFFPIIVLCGIILFFGLGVLIFSKNKIKKVTNLRDNGVLYFAQTVKAPTQIFGTKLKCACVIKGKPCLLACRMNLITYMALQNKNYIIISYDVTTKKFLPIRLFIK